MKKIIVILVSIAMLSCFAACSAANTSSEAETIPSETVVATETRLVPIEDVEEQLHFPAAPEENVLEEYLQEVIARRESGNNFIREDERTFYQTEGYYIRNAEEGYVSSYDEMWDETTNYYFPIVWEVDGISTLFYTSEHGYVRDEEGNFYGSLHGSPEETLIAGYPLCAIEYEEETGTINVWAFGECVETHYVPEGAVYAGTSYWEGHLFRAGTDVYAFSFSEDQQSVQIIAHGVAMVLDSDYDATSDGWSQPLFLMTDGTVRFYWSLEEPLDSSNNLEEIEVEGGAYGGYRD